MFIVRDKLPLQSLSNCISHPFLYFILIIVHHIFQMVSGKGFEVPRRVYVDFEGINLRKKFLTGIEPESINMTIGENACVLLV